MQSYIEFIQSYKLTVKLHNVHIYIYNQGGCRNIHTLVSYTFKFHVIFLHALYIC